jgi:hypothetical protein
MRCYPPASSRRRCSPSRCVHKTDTRQLGPPLAGLLLGFGQTRLHAVQKLAPAGVDRQPMLAQCYA